MCCTAAARSKSFCPEVGVVRALTEDALTRIVPLSTEGSVRFAALMAGIDQHLIQALCERLRVPADYRDLARLAARFSNRLATGPAKDLLDVFEQSDALRRPERFEKLLLAAGARVSVDPSLAAALAAVSAVRLTGEQLASLKGPDIAIALHTARLQRLESLYHNEPRRS
jgi:hypothetical protein